MSKRLTALRNCLYLLAILLWIITARSFHPVLTLVAIAIHEGGHLLAVFLAGIHVKGMNLDGTGLRLTLRVPVSSYGREILICVAGPGANLLSALFVLPFFSFPCFFVSVSVALAVLNLLPIHSFDGGRILDALLSSFLPPRISCRITQTVSFLSLFALWACAVYVLLKSGGNLSLFFFCAALFFREFISDHFP